MQPCMMPATPKFAVNGEFVPDAFAALKFMHKRKLL